MMASSSPSSSPSPPPSSPKKIQNFFFQEMKSTCRDQARKSKFFFVFLHFCNFQQKKLKTLQIQKSHCSCPNQWLHPYSEHFMCIFNRWALQGPLDFNRYKSPLILGNPPSKLVTGPGVTKIPPQGPKKWPMWPKKKSLPSSYPQKIYLAKKMVQNGHLWPQQWSEQSSAAYMGSQPPTRWST